ncbi:aromatic hydrocarbon degradation protein [Flavobacteriaceae bacterium Ap0902]|nr:aromatic hydrocarbon degradation protein [Flavobacteriaceae bacterium Ap0902]
MKRNLIGLLMILMLSSMAYAGGYRVSLQGVRQAAMGGVASVLTHDASVMFYNPGALAFVDAKYSASAGVFGAFIDARYQNPNTYETEKSDNPVGTPLYAAFSYKPTEDLALGLSVTTPFGSVMDWGQEWSGRYMISKIDLKAIYIQPTVSYKINDWFGVGLGYIRATGNVNIQRNVAVGNTDALFELDTKGSGNGFNVGVMIKPSPKVNVGISYRSRITMDATDGTATWQNVPSLVSNSLPFSATTFTSELPLPYEAIFGLSYQVTPKLLLAGEISSHGWEEYPELVINLTDGTDVYQSTSIQAYDHTTNYKVGAEYTINPKFDVRLGYAFDKTPSPAEYFDPQTPSVDLNVLSLGIGGHFKSFNVDLTGEYVMGEEMDFHNMDTNFVGQMITEGYILGLGVSYNIK